MPMLLEGTQIQAGPMHSTEEPVPVTAATRRLSVARLPRETAWRRIVPNEMPSVGTSANATIPVVASRWTDPAAGRRQAEAEAPGGRHVVSIALRRTRLRLAIGDRDVFDGAMAEGTVHVAFPRARQVAVFEAPCDFVHLYAADAWIRQHPGLAEALYPKDRIEPAATVLRDPLCGQLARTLAEEAHTLDATYVESVARTVLLRVAALATAPSETLALPRWRLKRVQDHLAANLDDPVSLSDLARAAGLSRSYFAAKFRVATGYRPYEYVVARRIDKAKELLAETEMPIVQVALAVGFQTQAHFTTVFKRLTTSTPARWRRGRQAQD